MKSSTLTGLAALACSVLLAGTSASQDARQAGKQRSVDEATPRGRFERIVGHLETAPRPTTKQYLELREVLLDSPDLVAELPRLLRQGQIGPEAAATVIYALEEVGTGETQETLVEIHGDPTLRHEDRLRAAVSLGGVLAPTESAVTSLRTAVEHRSDPRSLDLANTSLLSLGRAGRRLRESGAQRYAVVRDDLLRRLRRTPERTERVITLKALGNLRDRELGAEISNYLGDEAATVRASAAQALGMLGDELYRDVLVALLPDEPIGAVRVAMVEALRELPADSLSLNAVHAMVRAEPHAESRAQMVSYLVDHLRGFEECADTLRFLTTSDPSNRVRMLAAAVYNL